MMKRAIFISVFFCFSIYCFAQQPSSLFNIGYVGDTLRSVQKAYALNDGRWLLGTQITHCFQNRSLIKLDRGGAVLWSNPLFSPVTISDIAVNNGSIFLAGYDGCTCLVKARDCEFDGCYFNRAPILKQLDMDGNVLAISNRPFPDSAFMLHDTLAQMHIAYADARHLIVTYGDSIKAFNTLDTQQYGWLQMWTKKTDHPINAIATIGRHIFVGTDTALMLIDTTGLGFQTNHQYAPVKGLYSTATHVFANIGNYVYKFDSMLNVLDSMLLMSNLSESKNLCGDNGKLALSTFNTSAQHTVLVVLDTSFTTTDTITTTLCKQPVSIAMHDTLILVTGNDSLHIHMNNPQDYPDSNTANSVYAITYATSGLSGNVNVAAVLSTATIDSTAAINNSGDWRRRIFNSFVLHNTGTETITNATIATDVISKVNCAIGPEQKAFYFTPLVPGDSIRLSISFDYDQTSSAILQQHFYLVALNGHHPALCEVSDLTSLPYNYTAIPETFSTATSVYPNPTNGMLNVITSNSLPSVFTLSDITGRLLIQQNITDGTTQINVAHLSQGLYIYSIKSGNAAPVTGKVEKL